MGKLLFVFNVSVSMHGDSGSASLSTECTLEVESVAEAETIATVMQRNAIDTRGGRFSPLYVVVGGQGIVKREWPAL